MVFTNSKPEVVSCDRRSKRPNPLKRPLCVVVAVGHLFDDHLQNTHSQFNTISTNRVPGLTNTFSRVGICHTTTEPHAEYNSCDDIVLSKMHTVFIHGFIPLGTEVWTYYVFVICIATGDKRSNRHDSTSAGHNFRFKSQLNKLIFMCCIPSYSFTYLVNNQ